MAGDWIKMRTNLDTDPRVFAMAESLGLDDLHVVGLLWKVWAWADSHTQDGNGVSVTQSRLDRITGVSGFADALRKVGWMEGRDGALTFPNFTEHNGQTAKTRANTAKRVEKHRNAASVTQALPEKRREEKSITHTHTQGDKPIVPKELAKCWHQWEGYVLERFGEKIGSIEAESMLMKLSQRGPDKAAADVAFSIEKRAKSILDSDHDFQKASTGGRQTKRNASGFVEI